MAKPICIIYFPENLFSSGQKHWIYDYMRYLNGEEPGDRSVVYGLKSDYWKEYYWFCFYKYGINDPEIKVFYEKDFTDIQFNELKELINQSLKQINYDTRP